MQHTTTDRVPYIPAQTAQVLSALVASKGYLIVNDFQISATKDDTGNFNLAMDRIGRGYERIEVSFNKDGYLNEATITTQRTPTYDPQTTSLDRSTMFAIAANYIPAILLIQKNSPKQITNAPRYNFWEKTCDWIDANTPLVALQPKMTIPKGALCYPIVSGLEKHVMSGLKQDGKVHVPEIGSYLAVTAVNTSPMPSSNYIDTIMLEDLRRIARAHNISIVLKDDKIVFLDSKEQQLDFNSTLNTLTEHFWNSYIPTHLKSRPNGSELDKPIIKAKREGIEINSFEEIVRALSVVHNSKTPLSQELATTITEVAFKHAFELAKKVSSLQDNNYKERNVAVRDLNQELAAISNKMLDGYDGAILLEYAFSIIKESGISNLKSPPKLIQAHKQFDQSPFRTDDFNRHFTILSTGINDKFALYLSYSPLEADTNQRTADVCNAISLNPVKEGATCTFPIKETRTKNGDVFWINLEKFGRELGVANLAEFIGGPATSHDHFDRIKSPLTFQGVEFELSFMFDDTFSHSGVHEFKPGFIGQIESEIFPPDQGGNELPTLHVIISGPNDKLFVSSKEQEALCDLIQKIERIGRSLHKA